MLSGPLLTQHQYHSIADPTILHCVAGHESDCSVLGASSARTHHLSADSGAKSTRANPTLISKTRKPMSIMKFQIMQSPKHHSIFHLSCILQYLNNYKTCSFVVCKNSLALNSLPFKRCMSAI